MRDCQKSGSGGPGKAQPVPAGGSRAGESAEHGSAGGGRRVSGKELVAAVAAQARENGFKRPDPFNITVAYGEAVWMLYQELAAWVDAAENGPTRGTRRHARRVCWVLRKALVDMKQDRSRVDSVASGETVVLLPSGLHSIPIVEAESAQTAYKIGRHRFLIALGSERLATQTRATLAISAFDRVGTRFAELGITPPIARVRERPSRPRASPARAVRGEDVLGVVSVDSESVSEGESRSEARTGRVSPRTARGRSRAREVDDGWD